MYQKLVSWWDNAKFDFSIRAIFIFAVIVSFSHTIELYSSVGFDIRIGLLNNLLGVDWFTLALFATLAAEASFAVGLWGLYEAYEQTRKFPSIKEYWQVWTLFGGGLIVVGWSNIGGTVGYDFLIGDPWKGVALGLSIPFFVLGSVLVNFKRGQVEDHLKLEKQVEKIKVNPPAIKSQMENSNIEIENLSNVDSSTPTPMENRMENITKVVNSSQMNTSTQYNMENTPPTLETTEVENTEKQEKTETPEDVVTNSNRKNSKLESGEIESPPAVENSTPVKIEVEKKKTSKVEVDPMEWALSYQKKHGELPGRKKLIEGTSCSEWVARKTLTQLKKAN